MTGALELVVVAAVAQLAVLPGEKVQFIIAGLSTRYDPFVVVAAAGSAFAGWTALELWFGNALQGMFAPVVLDSVTAGMFLLFAVLLYRAAPADSSVAPGGNATATDGGIVDAKQAAIEDFELSVFGYDLSDSFGSFLPIFAMMAAGEFGDKTQLVTIGLAVQYGARPAIWAGEMLVIIPVSLANALFFHRFSHRFDARKAHLAGATLFLFFGLDTVLALLTGFSVWEWAVGGVAGVVLALLSLA